MRGFGNDPGKRARWRAFVPVKVAVPSDESSVASNLPTADLLRGYFRPSPYLPSSPYLRPLISGRLSMAGFEMIIYGRFWVIAEERKAHHKGP
jgi:hypothetical protein